MIQQDDLRAAVGAGIVTEAQAASLAQLAHARSGARKDLTPGDEPFELFKGFNEIFIVIGLTILAIGWGAVIGVVVGLSASGTVPKTVTMCIVGGAVLWVLAEYFIQRRRMVAPAIALSVMWAINAYVGLTTALSHPFMVAQQDYSSLPFPMALATIAIAVFWWRFRVPFALAMIALGLFAVAIIWTASGTGTTPDLTELFLFSAEGPFAWVTLLLGACVFCVAMYFDMSDPHRVTRRAAQGFWLHVVAAPALVNTIALSLLDQDTTGAMLVLIVFLILMAIIAIVIDRRSFLIAAIGYIVTLSFLLLDGSGSAYSILILGAGLVLLGALWERMRARLLAAFGAFLPLDRLPPSV